HPRGPHYVDDPGLGVAALGEESAGRVEDGLLALLALAGQLPGCGPGPVGDVLGPVGGGHGGGLGDGGGGRGRRRCRGGTAGSAGRASAFAPGRGHGAIGPRLDPPVKTGPAPLLPCLDDAGRHPPRAHRASRAQPQVEEPAPAHRDVGVHQLRHLPAPLPVAVRRHLQPRHGRDHRPRAVLGLRQVPRSLPGGLHLRGSRLGAGDRGLVGGTAESRGSLQMTAPVMPGAEPWSAPGGPHGALVLHGFTGCPQSMRGLAQAFSAAGFAVELPLLPGHGTAVDDMIPTRWSDWSATAERAYQDLAGRCDKVVVAGLSMGGTLASWLAAAHPEVAGAVLVNPAVEPPAESFVEMMSKALEAGSETIPGVGGDLADPDAHELAYDLVPVRAALSLWDALVDLAPRL